MSPRHKEPISSESSPLPSTTERPPRVVLVGLQFPEDPPCEMEASLQEVRRLCQSLGWPVVGTVEQRRASAHAAHLLGAGKVEELRGFATTADAVVVDAEISPSQQANLERTLGLEVLDRTAVILRIFERQARTREAVLSVELARLEHETPRLKERTDLKDRAGGGGRGGQGHTGLELAKQRARKRMAQLRAELAQVVSGAQLTQRRKRDGLAVALVGYTNVGKSSLMRALTGQYVLVDDRLFATLGTTVRPMLPDAVPRILVTDTVGFVRKLPHLLVPSFRATLQEASAADLLLLVVDASDAEHAMQLQVTRDTLAQVAGDVPAVVVFNKVDRVEPDRLSELMAAHPGAMAVCALDAERVAALAAEVRKQLEASFTVEETVLVPYARPEVLARLHTLANVMDMRFGDGGTVARVRASAHNLARLRALLT